LIRSLLSGCFRKTPAGASRDSRRHPGAGKPFPPRHHPKLTVETSNEAGIISGCSGWPNNVNKDRFRNPHQTLPVLERALKYWCSIDETIGERITTGVKGG
jgi:hypothetical protein